MQRDQTSTDTRAWLIVGLGNPDQRFTKTPHNAGARAVEKLAERFAVKMRPTKTPALVADVRSDRDRVLLARTTTYMNESGYAVSMLMKWFSVDESTLIVVHDDIDLQRGTLRLKRGGGTAGNHGLDSILAHLRTKDFYRVRIGVGRPAGSKDPGEWLLEPISKGDVTAMELAEIEAGDAALSIIHDGLDRAMNKYNTVPKD